VQSTVRERVAEAVDDGTTLAQVEEELLRPAPVSQEAKDALWLYAWTLEDQRSDDRW
jgi:hypothetical protein